MFGAVPVQDPVAPLGKTHLKVPLGPLAHQRDPLGGNEGGEHETVSLLHGVRGGDKPLPVDLFDTQPMGLVGFLMDKGFQYPPAAGQGRGS